MVLSQDMFSRWADACLDNRVARLNIGSVESGIVEYSSKARLKKRCM